MLCLLSDYHLFNGVMALRKMDLFTIEALSDGKESTLIKVQDHMFLGMLGTIGGVMELQKSCR